MIFCLVYLVPMLLSLAGILVVGPTGLSLTQEKESKVKASSAPKVPQKASQPLTLKLEGEAQESSAIFESARLDLDRELRSVLRQQNRKGMDLIELTVSLSGPGQSFGLALVAKNFVPESTGPWDKQDVLSFLARGDGPVYLNLSLLQSMLQAVTSYRRQVLARSGGASLSIETWSVTFEKSSAEFLRYHGQFEGEKSVIHPTILVRTRKMGAPLEIKPDGEGVTQALERGTFPLPPLRILGQFSSTKLVMEFFGKE
jgi:hypothetical protein